MVFENRESILARHSPSPVIRVAGTLAFARFVGFGGILRAVRTHKRHCGRVSGGVDSALLLLLLHVSLELDQAAIATTAEIGVVGEVEAGHGGWSDRFFGFVGGVAGMGAAYERLGGFGERYRHGCGQRSPGPSLPSLSCRPQNAAEGTEQIPGLAGGGAEYRQ
ncbi:hypothetical protein B0H17DRAFT_1140845 [Mycena rosella]|uniref:Uncharacterized protein n=1 Tax=Mycena rosella TaxID=1033263 RepID=A0AAD7D188_MYCRO|nr:hypothetical protein B0H17DRAFT_1140845 [Mycena rosella]